MKCIVFNCENKKHQGGFVGELCSPCHEFITTNKGKFSQAYRNSFVELTDQEIKEIIEKHSRSSRRELIVEIMCELLKKKSEK